ncbi:MAG TPA: succinylglutamate desuccinylase/aspartoacylase family protein [Ramlibacter sp.]|nr:succinylglutamate desuccinylase/aspartoacylase family protein [Ramlibacter sp.]
MTAITLTDGSTQRLPPADALAGTNCGARGAWRFDSAAPGPHVAITALIHGNEVCGAHAAWQLVQTQPKPSRGKLTVVFCNLEAYARLDDTNKDDRRLVDEDLNRVWGRVDGPQAKDTYETRRAGEILPFVQEADVLLDLHSMTNAAPALGLVGISAKNVEFAKRVGYPALLVRDAGHASGLRLIDRAPFGDENASPVAMLVECGQHFSREALVGAEEAVRRTLAAFLEGRAEPAATPQTLIEITEAVTIQTDNFEWVRPWGNMEVVPAAGTLVGRDGQREVRTPHDGTYMVMPSISKKHLKRGLTAVRFGRRA